MKRCPEKFLQRLKELIFHLKVSSPRKSEMERKAGNPHHNVEKLSEEVTWEVKLDDDREQIRSTEEEDAQERKIDLRND